MHSSQVLEGNLDSKSDVGVILPTYCEAANIERLIVEIENSKRNISVLFIDDSSPDGTADIVRNFQRRYSNIVLLVRPKKSGLGTAITDGFKTFLSLKNPPKCMVTMDADYSHNPKDLDRLTTSLCDGYDLVIGSRYCKGGTTKGWSPIRLAISKIANLVASLVIGAKIHDYTSGLRCYSTNLVSNIIENLHSQTYEIQIETIRQANLQGFKIREIPITFANRKRGKSKLALNEITQFFSYILLRIRLGK